MSVLIKGMEMPKNCWEDDCPCLDKHYGICQAHWDKGYVYSDKPSWCPLVPVPEHGRLIDADRLEYEDAYLNGHYELGDVEIVTREYIESAPTIIPADKEG